MFQIEQRIRAFLWRGWENKKGCNLVRWDIVTKPKREGGLRIKRLKEMNTTFMEKIGWCLEIEKNSLWARILRAKYLRNDANNYDFKCRQADSKLWRGVVHASHIIKTGTRKMVINGKNTKFWTDKWLMKDCLKDHTLIEMDETTLNKQVVE